MKFKKLSAALALSCTLVAGNAAAIIVGGVDFGVVGLTGHIETTTVAERVVLADGQELLGYGVVDRVNGNLNYAVTPGEKLFFSFDQYVTQNFSALTTEFTGGIIDVYIGPDINFLINDSPTNIGIIETYTEWVRLEGHGNLGGGAAANATIVADGTLTGGSISFTGQGLLDVDLSDGFGLAAVANFWDGNSEMDAVGGFADITLTTSANSSFPNPNDTCSDIPQAGEWCLQGSADIRGATNVPEPSILALMGMGLFGAGAVSLRRKARKA